MTPERIAFLTTDAELEKTIERLIAVEKRLDEMIGDQFYKLAETIHNAIEAIYELQRAKGGAA